MDTERSRVAVLVANHRLRSAQKRLADQTEINALLGRLLAIVSKSAPQDAPGIDPTSADDLGYPGK